MTLVKKVNKKIKKKINMKINMNMMMMKGVKEKIQVFLVFLE